MDWSKPIGPLPTGAWVAVVGAGVGLVYWSRTHGLGGSSTNNSSQDLTPADLVGTGPGWVAVPPPDSAPVSAPVITTNDQWANQAITWLIAQGIEPTLADAAIRAYINGQDYSSPQYQKIIDMALQHFGAPPQTLTPLQNNPGQVPPPNNNPPPPPPKPPPPPPPPPPPVITPPTIRYFTVGHWPALDGSLWGIAVLMYGDGNRWPDIYNVPQNRALIGSNPNLIQPGMVLIIP